MALTLKRSRDPVTGLWTVTGDDGARMVTVTAGTGDEASALVQEAFGLQAYRPPPPLPPGRQRFSLIHSPVGARPAPDDALYDSLGATILGQLLLMAAERAPELGYGSDDWVRLLRRAMGE